MTDLDEVLLRFSAYWADTLEAVTRSIGGRVLRGPDAVAVDVGRPAGLQNSVVLLEPLEGAAIQALMTALNAFFAAPTAGSRGTVYLFSAWPVPDLTRFGWLWVEHMPLMERRPGGKAPSHPTGLRVSEVRTVTDLHHFEKVMVEGFPVPELQGLPPGSAFGPDLLNDPRVRFWLGWHEDKPVSAAASYISHGLVDLIFLATLSQVRGRGFGSALAWTATMVQPELPAMLIASQEGQPMYARLGYQRLCDMPLWIRERQCSFGLVS